MLTQVALRMRSQNQPLLTSPRCWLFWQLTWTRFEIYKIHEWPQRWSIKTSTEQAHGREWMEEVRFLSLFLFLQICSRVGAMEYPRLAFAAIGDFGGIPLPPYSTYTQKKIAKVMGKVWVYRESLSDFKTLLLLDLWSLFSSLLVACLRLFKFNGWPLLEVAKGTELWLFVF